MVPVAAVKTTVQVYTDASMTKGLTFQGVGYTDFINIRNGNINPSKIYKFFPITDANPGVDVTFPETYIYYVTRKPTYNNVPATPTP